MKLRRRWLHLAAAFAVIALTSAPALAGGQIEEPLADSVRTALSASIASSAPPRLEFESAQAMEPRLQRAFPEPQIRREFLQTVWYEARRAGLELPLVLGLIQVESGFRKFAVSSAGARGYMQVMPFWSRLIGDGDASRLFHLQTNLRFGCVILRHYLDRERGDVFLALGRYNGSRGQAPYPNAVLAASRQWAWAG
jgi:soluble lytic murein transglycosylase-like protein